MLSCLSETSVWIVRMILIQVCKFEKSVESPKSGFSRRYKRSEQSKICQAAEFMRCSLSSGDVGNEMPNGDNGNKDCLKGRRILIISSHGTKQAECQSKKEDEAFV